jgi:probable addiction module antidote protein
MASKPKTRAKETFSRYDTADHLKSEDDVVAYLQAVMEESGDDPEFIAITLGHISRARARPGFGLKK